MGKLATPDWVKEGFDSKADWQKAHKLSPNSSSKVSQIRETKQDLGKKSKKKTDEKTFKIRKCPKCGSDKVNVLLTGEEGKATREWECKKCKWTGKNIDEEELTEDEFMKYLDEKGEEVA